ncbi:Tetraspanin family [Nesidiocoris tenuis]|uniref:Tetraspanin family n=1 Tax=Nesidiocoris tenuis TaxID=355587 RepID=A0ABN7BF42_9HEMI|nr:Tetraspanin family [Nesidiocoris tenuis]
MVSLEIAFQVINGADVGLPVLLAIIFGVLGSAVGAVWAVIFAICFAGLVALGAISVSKKLPKLQLAYAIIQIILVAVLFLFAMICLMGMAKTAYDMIKDNSEKQWTPKMKAYLKNKDEVDKLQQQLKCCGTTAYKYEDSKYPNSCCEIRPCTVAFPKACNTAEAEKKIEVLPAMVTLLLVQLPVKIASITLIMLIRKRLMT